LKILQAAPGGKGMMVSMFTKKCLSEKNASNSTKSAFNALRAIVFFCGLIPTFAMSEENTYEINLCSDTKSIGMSEALLLAPLVNKQKWGRQYNVGFASRVESLDIVVVSANSDFSKVRCLDALPKPGTESIYDLLETLSNKTVNILGKNDRVFDGQNGLSYSGYTINGTKTVVFLMHESQKSLFEQIFVLLTR
jgi:hypothetical protein